jgi:hypothetical protein
MQPAESTSALSVGRAIGRTLTTPAFLIVNLFVSVCVFAAISCGTKSPVLDEALRAGRDAGSFPAADEDYFHDMDRGVPLTPDQVKGRNNWLVWTSGNDRFWDYLANHAFGVFDLLKTLSSHPRLGYGRDNRWAYLGLINEPCFEKATGPDPDRFGLWLDKRITGAGCPPDPFADARKYPGVAIGARGKTVPIGSFYGEPSGIVGLRLFPNPDFDEAAKARWDAAKFYDDPHFYEDRALVRPYRVGMACAFCHVGPSPIGPPHDPENPKWENLASNPGAQYFWVDRIFVWQKRGTLPAPHDIENNFAWQLFHTSAPGSLDTSFISTDSINNPRTMNAIYSVLPRLVTAVRSGRENLADGSLDNRQLNDFPQTSQYSQFFKKPGTVWTPRVLKDGADSVGVVGALNRVFVNIGAFSEDWLLHFNPLVGGRQTSPFAIANARKHSSYWNATEQQTPDLALFFLQTAQPDRLVDALDVNALKAQENDAVRKSGARSHDDMLHRGKIAFATRCARCHSSKIPPPLAGIDDGACATVGSNYLECWNRYWRWTMTDDFKEKMSAIVLAPDFLDGNYLSTERRVPVTLLETNACSPLASNAVAGNVWDNFSSQSYKELPAVGTITVHHPITGKPRPFRMPAGGRGYTRPPSLISVWSTAPFLLNNSIGTFNQQPSVAARLDAFNDAIEQLLWPQKRKKDIDVIRELGLPESSALDVPGYIYRTTATSYMRVANPALPESLTPILGLGVRWLPWLFGKDGLEIGPIPKGTPVNLLANLQLRAENPADQVSHAARLVKLIGAIRRDLKAIDDSGASPDEKDRKARDVFLAGDVVDRLLELSKCPDFVVNRGHYFGTDMFSQEPGLSDQDKWALVEFLKTF